MKRASEAEFGAALREVDLVSYVHRPPDARAGASVSNWKPCDWMVWVKESTDAYPGKPIVGSFWFECKDVDTIKAFAWSEMRPSQLAGIRDATRVGIPYWIAIWWRRQREWTISNGEQMAAWIETVADPVRTSIPRVLLESRMGVSSSRQQLTSTLKQVLLGEAS